MEAAVRSTRGCDSEQDGDSDHDFETSQLGTKEYWEDAYQKELETFKDIGDVGEIWFGEGSMNRVLRWMENAEIPEDAAILDIGTGNGAFLVEMAKHGYKNLTGIDYSPASVELAKSVLQAEGLTHVDVKVAFVSYPHTQHFMYNAPNKTSPGYTQARQKMNGYEVRVVHPRFRSGLNGWSWMSLRKTLKLFTCGLLENGPENDGGLPTIHI